VVGAPSAIEEPIRAECRGVKVIALSSHSDGRYVDAILDADACGYLAKANAYDELRRALDAASQRKSDLCSDVTQAVIRAGIVGER
jgi:DNA-binding NarL/FixJ family response regulator